MKLVIPKTTPYEIKRRERGAKVWAVQRALNSLQYGPLAEDGVYGVQTENAVIVLQITKVLFQDGVFGPQSSKSVAAEIAAAVTDEIPGLPPHLLRGIVEGESGNLIAAVNWNVPGGVDCGYCQRRVVESDYGNQKAIKRAFDSRYQIKLLASGLQSRHDSFSGKTGAKTDEDAWRLATLAHNYPSAAERIVADGISGLSSYYTSPQNWVIAIGGSNGPLKFPDGDPITSPLDWCQHYSLGNPAHQEPGMMTKYAFPL